MDRKSFLLNTSLSAFALSSFGFIVQGANGQFTGDCDTTNDILGPFYRPDAPLRSDLTYEGLAGTKIVLKGRVFKSDCITVFKDALVKYGIAIPKGNMTMTVLNSDNVPVSKPMKKGNMPLLPSCRANI